MGAAKNKQNELHSQSNISQLNKLRAAVLGANDGIVSIAGLVVGVAGATDQKTTILTAGLAGIAAGALSMAAGEYVSVSSQRDTEKARLAEERYELDHFPKQETAELKNIYADKGLSDKTASRVAHELMKKDAYKAHFEAELDIDPQDLVNPWQAAIASAAAFLCGALLPLITIMLPPKNSRIIITFGSTLVASAITGMLSARVGRAPAGRAIVRMVIGGALAMTVTYAIGRLIGASNL